MAAHERICLTTQDGASHLGTVLYRGPVPPTIGTWLGVEWDERERGKHDGVYDKTGVRYFSCRETGAGSFLRPNARGLSYGVSFRQAVHDKYLDVSSIQDAADAEEPQSSAAQAPGQSTFYNTSSNFRVEVTPLDDVRRRFGQLEKLREVGLEWEGVAHAGSEEERRSAARELQALETLNLSYSLLPSWQAVNEILQGLPKLRSLSLNSNRFRPLDNAPRLDGFARLATLNLNRTLIDWDQILLLSPSLPSLRELQLGDNEIVSLRSTCSEAQLILPQLETLNLSDNKLADWDELDAALAPLPSLRRLILSFNRVVDIASNTDPSPHTTRLRVHHLSLTNNAIKSWASVSALHIRYPELRQLWLAGNPFSETVDEADTRLEIIARVASIEELEGSRVSQNEREDAELWYIGRIRREAGTEEEKTVRHPRWPELCKKYEVAATPQTQDGDGSAAMSTSRLKNNLIRLHVTLVDSTTEPEASEQRKTTQLAVLPTLRTMLLRAQIAKALLGPGQSLPKTQWRLVTLLQPAPGAAEEDGMDKLRAEIPTKEEGRDISWWGLQDGDEIIVEKI